MTTTTQTAGTDVLVLTAPDPVTAIEPAKAAAAVALKPEQVAELDAKVDQFISDMTTMELHSPTFQDKSKAIQQLGFDEIRKSAAVSNHLLNKPTQAMGKSGPGEVVSSGLIDLRHELEDLDPSNNDGIFNGILAKMPFAKPMRRYFHKYQSAQSQLDSIVTSLYGGKETLEKDNAAIDMERANLWQTMEKLKQYIYMADQINEKLKVQVAEIKVSDPDRARELENDLLFHVGQKRQDLMTQLAVSVQGYLALDLIKKNNLELIKGVDRATTTTLSALRTAVIVAQALVDQKFVLDQITKLNVTTDHMIRTTSQMLESQTAETYKQAASSGVSLETLQEAFAAVYRTMDAIDTYKQEAIVSMDATVTSLRGEIEKAQPYIKRAQNTEKNANVLNLG